MKTDQQLRADVEAELKWDASVDDRAIIVGAKDGAVTLAGEVKSFVDTDVQRKIHDAFKRHADLDADKVHVAIDEGVVTLTGEVHSWHEREDAEIAAWSAPRVVRVKNDLSITL